MKKTASYIAKITQILSQELNNIPTPKMNENNRVKEFYFSIVFRSINALDSAAFLLHSGKNPFFRYSYALIARTIVMDIILSIEVMSTEETQSEDDLKNLLDRIYTEHHSSAMKNLRTTRVIYQKDEFYKKIEASLIEKNTQLGGIDNKNVSLYQLIRANYGKYGKEWREIMTELFEHFDLFSKLAHFGENSMELMTDQVKDCSSKIGDITIKRNAELIILFLMSILKRLKTESKIEDLCIESYKELVEHQIYT